MMNFATNPEISIDQGIMGVSGLLYRVNVYGVYGTSMFLQCLVLRLQRLEGTFVFKGMFLLMLGKRISIIAEAAWVYCFYSSVPLKEFDYCTLSGVNRRIMLGRVELGRLFVVSGRIGLILIFLYRTFKNFRQVVIRFTGINLNCEAILCA